MSKKVTVSILAVLLLGGGIFYAVQNDPYEGWETYTNEEYGFSFMYPSSLYIEKPFERPDMEDRPSRVTLLGDRVLDRVDVRDRTPYGMLVSVILFDNSQNFSASQWMDEKVHLLGPVKGTVTKTVTVNDVPAQWDEVGPDKYHGFGIDVVIPNGNNVFEIDVSTNPAQLDMTMKEARVVFQRIMDSFKFTPATNAVG